MRHHSLVEFINAVDEAGDVLRLSGVSMDLEAGALGEVLAEQDGPLLLFEDIAGLDPAMRVAVNVVNSPRRFATAMGMPADVHPIELVDRWRKRVRGWKPIEPAQLSSGRVTEVVKQGADVDIFSLPTPRWHELDGGPYIGTGDLVVTKDPDSDWVNCGTYRCCVQGSRDVSLWIIAAKHGRIIAHKYWERGQDCPIAIVLGTDPVTWMAANSGVPEGLSEYAYAGALHESPVELVETPIHGLPVPAGAEIVLEGVMVDPAKESVSEGPFGEWPGYYAHKGMEPVVHVQAIMRAADPVLYGAPPYRPIGATRGVPSSAASLWDHLERSGISDVTGVWTFDHTLMNVISLKPRYAGHAKQALVAAAGFRMYGSMYCYYVAVDEDIDPTNLEEVVWAMCTRVDPSRDTEVINGAWTSGLDPRVPPAAREQGELLSGRLLIDATRPFAWRDEFPVPNRFDRATRQRVIKRWEKQLSGIGLDWSRV